MDITLIPFNKFMQISHSESEDHGLELRLTDTMKNHLGTFHAAAQFALAEACSGLALQQHFPELAGAVVAVLRGCEPKFKKPAQSDIRARSALTAESISEFSRQFEKKGRAIIAVPVEVMDQNEVITMTGTFVWFVQKLS